MNTTKLCFLIVGLVIYTFTYGQYSGIDIYTGIGLPFYTEKSYPEKNLDSPWSQACPPVSRPGYFTEGGTSYLIGSTVGYQYKKFHFKAGLSYTFYQLHVWADPDSAIKYIRPICPDPYVDILTKFNVVNLPLSVGYSLGKFGFAVQYGFPIFTLSTSQSTHYSGAKNPESKHTEWFYRNSGGDGVNHFVGLEMSYNITSQLSYSCMWIYNDARLLNHLFLNLKYTLGAG